MLDSNRYIQVIISGRNDYRCLLTPENVIVDVEPKNDFLLYKNINDLYKKYKHRIEIKNMSLKDPLYLINEDIYLNMLEKNPQLEYLVEKFNCELS